MNTLDTDIVANLLGNLHQAAHDADHAHFEQMMAEVEASGAGVEQWAAKLLDDEKAGLRSVYQGYAEHFLSVSPEYRAYVRDPGNGYLSQTLAMDAERGNDFTVRIG